MIKKVAVLFLGLTLIFKTAFAVLPPDEGMWLPLLLKQLNFSEMKRLGLKLSAEEVYSTDKPSVKDAIVQLGGFCTAEVISDQGLLLTNHHCAFDAIRTHSSVENDYLTDGFWAKNKGEEKHTPGLTVSFLVKMEDVTSTILAGTEGMDEADMETKIQTAIGTLEAEASEDGAFKAQVKPMFKGNEYFLFVYEVFRDVRLVGAPPSSIGKFGGDTDNWMWPRHTGDFSLLRVYAGKDNKPADYAEDNVPYRPKHFLPISLKGVKEGDFAMIMGYPGSTDRYLTSDAIRQAYDNNNPDYIRLLDTKLKVMKKEMDASDEVRIALASDYASTANTYKYFLGQNRGLTKRGLIEEREQFENKFTRWVNQSKDRKEKYADVLAGIKQNISDNETVLKLANYINIAIFGNKVVQFGVGFYRLQRTMAATPDKPEAWEPVLQQLRASVDEHFEEYQKVTDMKVFAAMNRLYYNDLPKEFHLSVYTDSKTFTKSKPKGNKDRFDIYAEKLFATSMLGDKAKVKAFLENPTMKALEKDPGMEFINSFIEVYRSKMAAGMGMYAAGDDVMMKKYMAALREMMPDKAFYPDANFTMRLTYGKVIPYDPRDGVSYKYYTSAEGILEKEVPGDEEFDVHPKLKNLIQKQEFGKYGKDELSVCFLTDNDITGGNSGSPVINGKGELIGVAFDGNWESMTSDLVFDDDIVRTICVDARYVCFVIDKFADARHLLDEMKIVR